MSKVSTEIYVIYIYIFKYVLCTENIWDLLIVTDMTQRDIKDVGFISAFPNIANMVLLPAAGYFVDYIQNKNILTSTQVLDANQHPKYINLMLLKH